MSLRQIAKDIVAGKLQLSEEELATERLKLCKECPQMTKLSRQCKLCGCFLDLKVKVLNAQCPMGKW